RGTRPRRRPDGNRYRSQTRSRRRTRTAPRGISSTPSRSFVRRSRTRLGPSCVVRRTPFRTNDHPAARRQNGRSSIKPGGGVVWAGRAGVDDAGAALADGAGAEPGSCSRLPLGRALLGTGSSREFGAARDRGATETTGGTAEGDAAGVAGGLTTTGVGPGRAGAFAAAPPAGSADADVAVLGPRPASDAEGPMIPAPPPRATTPNPHP